MSFIARHRAAAAAREAASPLPPADVETAPPPPTAPVALADHVPGLLPERTAVTAARAELELAVAARDKAAEDLAAAQLAWGAAKSDATWKRVEAAERAFKQADVTASTLAPAALAQAEAALDAAARVPLEAKLADAVAVVMGFDLSPEIATLAALYVQLTETIEAARVKARARNAALVPVAQLARLLGADHVALLRRSETDRSNARETGELVYLSLPDVMDAIRKGVSAEIEALRSRRPEIVHGREAWLNTAPWAPAAGFAVNESLTKL
jgi:hypothetical protein